MKNKLKTKLYNGETCLGTWVFIPSTEIVEIIGLVGFDFIVIDMEHSPISYESSIDMMHAAESKNLNVVLRVPKLDSSCILRALDSGALGLQVPHVSTLEDASQVVNFSKYYPIGSRGMAPNSRSGDYSYDDAHLKPEIANDSTLIVLNIEGIEGIKKIYQKY